MCGIIYALVCLDYFGAMRQTALQAIGCYDLTDEKDASEDELLRAEALMMFRKLHDISEVQADTYALFEKLLEYGLDFMFVRRGPDQDELAVGAELATRSSLAGKRKHTRLQMLRASQKRLLERQKLDEQNSQLRHRVDSIFAKLKVVDVDLARHLEQKIECQPMLLLVHHIRCLMCRSYKKVLNILPLFDYILCSGASEGYPKFDHLCLAMFEYKRSALLEAEDVGDAMSLMNMTLPDQEGAPALFVEVAKRIGRAL